MDGQKSRPGSLILRVSTTRISVCLHDCGQVWKTKETASTTTLQCTLFEGARYFAVVFWLLNATNNVKNLENCQHHYKEFAQDQVTERNAERLEKTRLKRFHRPRDPPQALELS